MKPLTLQETAAAMGGRVFGQITLPRVNGVCIDSRNLTPGCLFIAIKGDRFDGHDFVNHALESHAAAAVVSDFSRVDPKYRTGGRLIEVDNTTEALGKLAGWYRRELAAQVIAVVGSNGKTTTKDMIATVLASRRRGQVAKASFNNAIGVPLTLLGVDTSDEFVVVEVGTNHPGEIAALGRIVRPDNVVVTSIGEEHLEFLRDLKGVAREEFSILGEMQEQAFVAVSDQAAKFAPQTPKRNCTWLTYGLDPQADLRATDIKADRNGQRFLVNGRFKYQLPLLGRHNVVNALAAIAIGTRLRLTHEEIAAALTTATPPKMRLEKHRIGSFTLINDAYNANPSSMRVAFDTLDQIVDIGRKVLIIGDMRELGTEAERCHHAVGRDAGKSTAQVIIAVGAFARAVSDGATQSAGMTKRIYSYPTVEALGEKIGGLLESGDIVLMKASRGVQLERIVPAIEAIRQPALA